MRASSTTWLWTPLPPAPPTVPGSSLPIWQPSTAEQMTAGVGRGLLPAAQPPPLLNKPTQRFTLAGHFLHQQPLTALIRRIACDVITQLAPAPACPGRYPYLPARRYRPHGHNGEPGHL